MTPRTVAPVSAAQIAARLDRLPMSRTLWRLVLLISLGGACELYDLFLTACLKYRYDIERHEQRAPEGGSRYFKHCFL